MAAQERLEQLLQECLEGNARACDRLLSDGKYRQRIERVARKETAGTSLWWEDAAQEAHTKVISAIARGKFREGGVTKFYSWTAKVAQNCIRDLLRRERQTWMNWQSLTMPGTDITLEKAIADYFDLADAVEQEDLAQKALEAVKVLDNRYPQKNYLRLVWGRFEGKKQSELAGELGVGQSEISKRCRELALLVGKELGLLSVEEVERSLRKIRQGKRKQRDRSDKYGRETGDRD